MKKIFSLIVMLMVAIAISAQTMNVVVGNVTYQFPASEVGDMTFSGGNTMTAMGKTFLASEISSMFVDASSVTNNSKRINIKVMTGTTNTLTDATSGSQKGCLYVKGHPEFKQKGTLNIYGNAKHGIKAGEYVSIKNATINVLKAGGDGLNCTQYFLMESGELNISGEA